MTATSSKVYRFNPSEPTLPCVPGTLAIAKEGLMVIVTYVLGDCPGAAPGLMYGRAMYLDDAPPPARSGCPTALA
jgi:hypothetical protein